MLQVNDYGKFNCNFDTPLYNRGDNYLYKAKKRGQTCIGCPYAKQCGGKCNGQVNKKQ